MSATIKDDRLVITPNQRRQRNHDEVTASILRAAQAVMREKGAADLNLQAVARRVGMRAPSLYHYFDSRNAIYEALFVLGMRMYRERLEGVFAEYGATWEGLQRTIMGYLSFALEYPELYQLLFERPVPGFVPSAEGLAEGQEVLNLGRRMAAQAIGAGVFRTSASPEAVADLVIALIHGLTAQHLANEPHLPAGEGRFGGLVPAVMDLLRRAWAPEDGSI